jgi:hypothetical protein
MERHILITADGNSNSTLRILRVRFAELFFRDHQHLAGSGQSNRGTQAGYARAYNDKVRLRWNVHKI